MSDVRKPQRMFAALRQRSPAVASGRDIVGWAVDWLSWVQLARCGLGICWGLWELVGCGLGGCWGAAGVVSECLCEREGGGRQTKVK